MNRYAANTRVPVSRSVTELIAILTKFGASRVATLSESGTAAVAFEHSGIRVRLEMSVPSVSDFWPKERDEEPRGWRSWDQRQREAWCRAQSDQAARQRWRALLLVTKAKFEIIADGLSTVSREFMADMVLPNGQRFEQWAEPQMKRFEGGKMPPLLPRASE